jgi:hypothetical protein
MTNMFLSKDFELYNINGSSEGSKPVFFISTKESTFLANTKEEVSQLHKMHNDISEVIKEGRIGYKTHLPESQL